MELTDLTRLPSVIQLRLRTARGPRQEQRIERLLRFSRLQELHVLLAGLTTNLLGLMLLVITTTTMTRKIVA